MLVSVGVDDAYEVWAASIESELDLIRWSFPSQPVRWRGHPYYAQASRFRHLALTGDRWKVEMNVSRPPHIANFPPNPSGPNKWRVSAPFQDLSDRDLSQMLLRRSDLSGTDLSGAVLYGACLEDADVREADFEGAHFHDLYDPELHNTWFGSDARRKALPHDWRQLATFSSPAGLPVRFSELANTPSVESTLRNYPLLDCLEVDRRSLTELAEATDFRLLLQWVAELDSCVDGDTDSAAWSTRFLAWYWLQHGHHALRRMDSQQGIPGAVLDGATARGDALYLHETLLDGRDLRGQNLVCADLSGASLLSCNLTGVSLLGADLRSADLSTAKGMALSELAGCWIDRHTQLPKYLVEPYFESINYADSMQTRDVKYNPNPLSLNWSHAYVCVASPIGEPVSYKNR